MEYFVITFKNTHGAIASEKHLKKQFRITIMPTPREISKGCGISLRAASENFDEISKSLRDMLLGEDMYKIYSFQDGEYKEIDH